MAKAARTLGLNVPISEVFDKIDKLACAGKSLNKKGGAFREPKDCA